MNILLFEWKDGNEDPKKEGYYLVVRADCSTPEYLPSVEHFGYQEETERKWSREFKKEVEVVIKSDEMKWQGNHWDDSWIIWWADLPKTPSKIDKRNRARKLFDLRIDFQKELKNLDRQIPQLTITEKGIMGDAQERD